MERERAVGQVCFFYSIVYRPKKETQVDVMDGREDDGKEGDKDGRVDIWRKSAGVSENLELTLIRCVGSFERRNSLAHRNDRSFKGNAANQ